MGGEEQNITRKELQFATLSQLILLLYRLISHAPQNPTHLVSLSLHNLRPIEQLHMVYNRNSFYNY